MSEPPAQALRGETGAGGLYAVWPERAEDVRAARHIEFQYGGMAHQAETALSGMWLFLATELLFFGGLFLIACVTWSQHPVAIARASAHTEFGIGTANTVILLLSSASFTWGISRARSGDNRALLVASMVTSFLGIAFLVLKGFEWHDDFDKHLFPGPGFAMAGPGSGIAQIFWSFYFLATFLHGLHMIAGVILVGWIGNGARACRFSEAYYTPVEAVGLYWSFVDMMWLCLYPLIYLPGLAAA